MKVSKRVEDGWEFDNYISGGGVDSPLISKVLSCQVCSNKDSLRVVENIDEVEFKGNVGKKVMLCGECRGTREGSKV